MPLVASPVAFSDVLGGAVGGIGQIHPTPALMNVGNGEIVVVRAIVILVQQFDGGMDQRGLDEGGAGIQIVHLFVEVAPHDCRAAGQGIRHGGAAHVFVSIVQRVTPTVVLPFIGVCTGSGSGSYPSW